MYRSETIRVVYILIVDTQVWFCAVLGFFYRVNQLPKNGGTKDGMELYFFL